MESRRSTKQKEYTYISKIVWFFVTKHEAALIDTSTNTGLWTTNIHDMTLKSITVSEKKKV
jgi:hypothetical protein